MPSFTILVDAVLFDMDGTLIDSTSGVLKVWDLFAKQYGFDANEAAHASHGRRLYDTLKVFCKIEDEDTLLAEIARFEEEVILGGPVALPGAIELINQILRGSPNQPTSSPDSPSQPPPTPFGWTIVTSATSYYTPRALNRCGVPIPLAGIVCSNDVSRGKPHPDPYIAGAAKCGVDPSKCLVIEDAPSGIRAGHAAGAQTLAVCTSHNRNDIIASGTKPHFIVTDLTKVSARWVDGKVELTLDDSI